MGKPPISLIDLKQSFWRLLAPKWAHDPLSGKGAATHGGRFNRVGEEALYLSVNLETAVAEYGQDIPDRPGTFCRFDVETSGIVDLRTASLCFAAEIDPNVLTCPWKKMLLIDKVEPPTWQFVKNLQNLGANGILVPSQRHPIGYNLVLWNWDANSVKAYDPNKDMPATL